MALLIRESNQAPFLQLTKMGGNPLAPPNTQWVGCTVCGGWMQFIGQIDLEETAIKEVCERKQLLLIFMCTNNPGMCDEWDADLGGNAGILVDKTNLTSLEAPCDKEEFLLEETLLTLDECNDSADTYCQFFNQSQNQVCGKIGGEPLWIQTDETPICSCGARMTFVVQLEHSAEVQFGDAGAGYGFVCLVCQQRAKFLFQCC
ncbi:MULTISPECIES: DUF1963 domain-containing protein [unclassified Nostoc]|uniref:DUF1963 domain-containing protein n=1 Tax=unclassified Nostoc TaxID=2593658 RepID=UPI001D238BD8|nr:DUF1963 domain-containing protein [Nostoc sp. JL23]MBN3880621.1 DUF1963 domain-containing protein [Nostoc sp. JL23]